MSKYNCTACGKNHDTMKEVQACHLAKRQASKEETPPVTETPVTETPVMLQQGAEEKANQQGKFRKKPIMIEAFKFGAAPMPDWFMEQVSQGNVLVSQGNVLLRSDAPEDCHIEQREEHPVRCEIKTLEGTMIGDAGDYIIKGIQGEIYPCKTDIFEETYISEDDYQAQASDTDTEAPKPIAPKILAADTCIFILSREVCPEELSYLSNGQYAALKIMGFMSEAGFEVDAVEHMR